MVVLLIWVTCAVFSAFVASSKGRSIVGWFVLGFLFGPLALIAVGLSGSIKEDPLAPTPETHVRCPECREFVFRDATKCKHCGTKLIPVPEEPSRIEDFGRYLGSMFSKKK